MEILCFIPVNLDAYVIGVILLVRLQKVKHHRQCCSRFLRMTLQQLESVTSGCWFGSKPHNLHYSSEFWFNDLYHLLPKPQVVPNTCVLRFVLHLFFSLLLIPTPKSLTDLDIWMFWNATRFKQLQELLLWHFQKAVCSRMTLGNGFSLTPFTFSSLGTSEVLHMVFSVQTLFNPDILTSTSPMSHCTF